MDKRAGKDETYSDHGAVVQFTLSCRLLQDSVLLYLDPREQETKR